MMLSTLLTSITISLFSYLRHFCTNCCGAPKSSLTFLLPYELQPTRLLWAWDFSGKNTGAGCHFLLQGIFPIWDGTASPASAGRFSTTGPPEKPVFVPIKWAQSIKTYVHIVLGYFFIFVLFDINMLVNFVHFCVYIHFVCTYN